LSENDLFFIFLVLGPNILSSGYSVFDVSSIEVQQLVMEAITLVF
jgi:hypothetical protein